MKIVRPSTPIIFGIVAVASGLITFQFLGAGGIVLTVVAWALWLVWRFDNWTGSCFILAILLLLVIIILLMLVVLLALVS